MYNGTQFNHSVRVPRFYKEAAKILKKVESSKGSIKQAVFAGDRHNIKGKYALVTTVFQRANELDSMLKKSKILIKEPRADPWLLKILITELLWGTKRLPAGSKPIDTILAYEQILKAHLSDEAFNTEPELEQVQKPRYVRINTLKVSIDEAINNFRDEGWILKPFHGTNYQSFLEAVQSLTPDEFMVDMHLPYLLIFPPKTQFYRHDAYLSSSVILQDKASCLPVHILAPPPGSTVLDMCAAPGMKTTHLAAYLANCGVVHAVEMNPGRFGVLQKIVQGAGATCVQTINRDILTMNGNDIKGVEYVIVDPSCSGSGITDRVEVGHQSVDKDTDRLSKLAGFQIKILRAALTRYFDAKRVVYSTCSLLPEENEDVVRQVIEGNTDFKLVAAGPHLGEGWINFGSPDFGEIGARCLYARPEIDLTDGFFVAVFERLEKDEVNEFLCANYYKKLVKDAQLAPRKSKAERKWEKREKQLAEIAKQQAEVGEGGEHEVEKKKGVKSENEVESFKVKSEEKNSKLKVEDQKEEKQNKKIKNKENENSKSITYETESNNFDGLKMKSKKGKFKVEHQEEENLEKMVIIETKINKKKKSKNTSNESEGNNLDELIVKPKNGKFKVEHQEGKKLDKIITIDEKINKRKISKSTSNENEGNKLDELIVKSKKKKSINLKADKINEHTEKKDGRNDKSALLNEEEVSEINLDNGEKMTKKRKKKTKQQKEVENVEDKDQANLKKRKLKATSDLELNEELEEVKSSDKKKKNMKNGNIQEPNDDNQNVELTSKKRKSTSSLSLANEKGCINELINQLLVTEETQLNTKHKKSIYKSLVEPETKNIEKIEKRKLKTNLDEEVLSPTKKKKASKEIDVTPLKSKKQNIEEQHKASAGSIKKRKHKAVEELVLND